MPIFTSIGLALGATVAASAGAGLGAFAVGVAATGLAGAAIGTSMSSKAKATTQAKNAANDANVANQAAIKTVKDAQVNASNDAAAKISQVQSRIRRSSQSIYTSPLGISAKADITRKKLLGE